MTPTPLDSPPGGWQGVNAPMAEWERDLLEDEALSRGLDPGVRDYVMTLRAGGVETFESCQGGPDPTRPDTGHAYPDPTVRFHGPRAAGWHALSVAHHHDLPVQSLSRIWPILDGEPVGPYWEMVFRERADT